MLDRIDADSSSLKDFEQYLLNKEDGDGFVDESALFECAYVVGTCVSGVDYCC